jgi:hypothetical protein
LKCMVPSQEGGSGSVYLCQGYDRGIEVTSFHDFSILFWNCSNNVVFLVYHFILRHVLESVNNSLIALRL